MSVMTSRFRLFRGASLALEELAERAAGGDREAFDLMVERLRPQLRAYLSRRLKSADVDDVLQDCFVSGWKNIGAFERRSGVKAWLYAVADNRLRDHYRTRSRRPVTTSIEGIEKGGLDESAQVTDAEWIRQSLVRLPAEQVEILRLYYESSLTLAEIASTMNRNLNTVKYHFYRAHKTLEDEMKEGAKS